MTTQTLQYVEIQSEQVLIDSRVYCRDVIQVDHSDWFTDTLLKHQTLVESYLEEFIRFETDKIHNDVKCGRPIKYALLTENQCNAFLVLSKNLEKTKQAKLQLVADFKKAKEMLTEHLERQFQASLTIPAIPDISSTLVVDNSAEISELQQKVEKLEQDLTDQCKQLQDYQAKTQNKIDNLQADLEWHKQHPEMTLQEHINEVMCYFVNLVSDPKDSKKLQEFQNFAKTYKYPGEGLIRFNPNNPCESLAEDAWYSRFLRAKAGVVRKLIKIFQKTAVEECLQAAGYGLEGSYIERGRKAYEKEVLIYRHLLKALDIDLN